MKTWITYLAALFLGLATTLLLGDTNWILPALYSLENIALSAGAVLAALLVIFSLPAAVASLRKDHLGGKIVTSSLAWAIVTAFLLPIVAALIAGFFPVSFPASSTAGSGTVADDYILQVFASAYQMIFSGNIAFMLAEASVFILPLIVVAFFVGLALKPDADVIRPAYITMNSFSEVMFRLSRGFSYFGYFFVYLTGSYMFTAVYQEKTFFFDAAFSIQLVLIPLVFSLVILPVLFEVFTKGKKNPYKILYRNLATQIAALTSGNYVFTMPFMMSGERYNDGVQKRISASSSPLFYIIGRGGSAAIATFSIISIVTSVQAGAPVPLSVCLVIALACGICSFACSFSAGFEIMFITIAAVNVMKIDLYSAELTMLGLLPVLSGLAVMVDAQIAIFGSSIAAYRAGVDVDPDYRDIL